MTTSTQPSPDQATTLIRISPKRIQTQVTQAVRYRPVRSLLLLGLLVLVSLFVLFTLSQMAVVQHTMMAHLGTGVSPALAAPGGGGSAGGGRVSKGSQRPWRSQFNQFKIEPLLVRNAPSVEVNSAMAANRRMASQIAAIIVRNSLLVSHSAHSAHSNLSSHNSLPPHPQSQYTPYKLHGNANTSHFSSDSLSSSHAHHKSPLPPSPRSSAAWVDRGASPVGVVRQSGGREGVKSVTETTRTTYRLKNSLVSQEENIKQTTVLDTQQLAVKSRKETTSSNGKKLVKGPVFMLKDARKQKTPCNSGDCSGQNNENSLPVKVLQNTTSDKDEARRNQGINSYLKPEKKKKDALNFNQTHSHHERLTDTELKLQHRSLPDTPLYEPVDSEDTDEVYRKDDNTRKRSPTPHLSEDQLRKLPLCPEIPPGLLGRLNVDLDYLEKLHLEDVLHQLAWVTPGGSWSPIQDPSKPCLPRHKVAVVLPYRDRLQHLIILLSWLHPILRRQQLEYTVYVAEQIGNATFNKGSIMNAGFMEAWQRSDAECFVFHDVDMLPEDDRNMYSCPPQPRHLSVGVDTLGYKLPYFLLVGGVLSVRGDHFLRLNGYSNMYWGWGGEDDDMGYRIKKSGLSITRPANWVAKYTMIRHLKRKPLTWKVRGKLLRTSGRRYRLDGLNTLKYTLQGLHRHPLFTHLLLDVGTPPENLLRLDRGNLAHPSKS